MAVNENVMNSMNSTASLKNTTLHRREPKVLYAIYTYGKRHETLVQAVVDTWAWKCDGFLAASTITDETLGAIDLPHQGPEEYKNMWQKTRSIWAYIHDNYLDDFDYFWLGGDDVLLIVENLRNFLVEDSESNLTGAGANNTAAFLGSQVRHSWGDYFCHGGPGYILNKAAVRRLISEVLPKCYVS